jgi:hypothetical protein
MEFQCFFQIGKCLLFSLTLTGDINFQALGDVPIAFAPNGRSKRSLHGFILSQAPTGCGLNGAGVDSADWAFFVQVDFRW